MRSKFMRGTGLLVGDARVPGVPIDPKFKELLPIIFRKCREFGLDFYNTIVEFLTYDQISELAAYGGFPVRYPHWQFGMEYEELQKGYEHGMHRIYEMVVNNDPCLLYCLDSNTLLDNVLVVAHALGHNDFFKNNIHFAKTNRNMLNKFADHGDKIRKYMNVWGKNTVTEFINHCLRVDNLVDPAAAWRDRVVPQSQFDATKREYDFPFRTPVREGHEYMDRFLNPRDQIEKQRKQIEENELAMSIGLQTEPTRDIVGFLRDYAPLQLWQRDVLGMMYDESMYFNPQGTSKMLNEGWASWVDHKMMASRGLAALGQPTPDAGIVEYALHKMRVLGGENSMNPYSVGFKLFCDIEDRWNKGKFGREYDDCENLVQKQDWDLKLGQGEKKCFEVRKLHNDFTAILEYFTPEFCRKHKFYTSQWYNSGDQKIASREFAKIKGKMLQKYLNGGRPEIRLADHNHRGNGTLLLQHEWDGRFLYHDFVQPVLESLHYFWRRDIVLATRNYEGEEVIYLCYGLKPEQCVLVSREDYELSNKKRDLAAG